MITERQSEALNFIVQYQNERGGVSPSLDEIAAGIKASSRANIMRLLIGLEERGFIRRMPGITRAIEVIRVSAILPTRIAYFKWDDEIKQLVPRQAEPKRVILENYVKLK